MKPFVSWARSLLNAHDTTLAESNLLADRIGDALDRSITRMPPRASTFLTGSAGEPRLHHRAAVSSRDWIFASRSVATASAGSSAGKLMMRSYRARGSAGKRNRTRGAAKWSYRSGRTLGTGGRWTRNTNRRQRDTRRLVWAMPGGRLLVRLDEGDPTGRASLVNRTRKSVIGLLTRP